MPLNARPFPSRRQEQLLGALLLDPDEAIEAWGRWWQVVDREGAVEPGSERVLPMIFRRLEELGIDGASAPFLKQSYKASWRRNQLLSAEGAELIFALEALSIPTLLLKGGALQATLYTDGGVRSMADLDILVPPDRARQACVALQEAGWRCAGGRSGSDGRVRRSGRAETMLGKGHHVELSRGGGLGIELHWYSMAQVASDAAFWEASTPIEIAGAPTAALCPADQLLHICVHGMQGEPGHRLIWIMDASGVIRAAEHRLDWDRLVAAAAARNLTTLVEPALAYLRDSWRLPVPGEALERLANVPSPRFERIGSRAILGSGGPTATLRIAWDRYRRYRLLEGQPIPRPSYLSVLQMLWGPRSRLGMLGAALRSLGRSLSAWVRPSRQLTPK